MSLKDFLQKQKRAVRGLLAASAVFAGGISTAGEVQEQSVPQTSALKQSTAQSKRQKTFEKIDTICLAAVRKNLIIREGDIPCLYLDSKGILHTGIGLNVNDYSSFKELDFVTENGTVLTEKEKKAYFARIKAFQRQQAKLGFNYKSSYYARHFTIRPSKNSRDKMFVKRMYTSMQSIKEMLGTEAFYNLHPLAQAELIMMHYNMGSNRFNPKKWPKLFSAAKRADYITMSQECHTKSVSEARNQMVASTLKKLAKTKRVALGTQYVKINNNLYAIYKNKTM